MNNQAILSGVLCSVMNSCFLLIKVIRWLINDSINSTQNCLLTYVNNEFNKSLQLMMPR